MIFFELIRVKVRSFYTWCFACLMLLSSGSMQLVLHNCPGSGVFIYSDCGMHESGESHEIPECCKKKFPSQKPKKQDCGNCEDYFVFSITPKFGNVVSTETGEPPVIALEKCLSCQITPFALHTGACSEARNNLPPKLLYYQALHCAWLI